MQAIAPLMIEHRLIMRLVGILAKELDRVKATGQVDHALVAGAVDFFRVLADRTHHGKEEKILFRELAKKPLSAEHGRIMKELMVEHVQARQHVAGLEEEDAKLRAGDTGALARLIGHLETLLGLYPRHIEKEDKHFFLPVMAYFSTGESDAMLAEGYAADAALLTDIYRAKVDGWEII